MTPVDTEPQVSIGKMPFGLKRKCLDNPECANPARRAFAARTARLNTSKETHIEFLLRNISSPNRHTVVTGLKLCDDWRRDMQAAVKPRILVVDDEPEAVELVEFNLKQAGYAVITAADGAEALKKARGQTPDLIVLDVMLPEMDGFEICKTLRLDPATAKIPILMLTAKAAEIDRVLGLELGADDYLTKPFSPRELLLRIKKILARGQTEEKPKEQLRFGDLLIDLPRHIASWKGKADRTDGDGIQAAHHAGPARRARAVARPAPARRVGIRQPD